MKTFYCLAVSLVMCLPNGSAVALDKGEPKHEQPLWGRPVEGLRLSLRSAQTEYAVGDKIEVQMVVQNVGAKDRDIVDTYPLNIFRFQVKGPDGKVLALNKRGRRIQDAAQAGRRAETTLKPNGDTTFGLDKFNQIYDLEPGEYQVTASMDVHQQDNLEKWSELTSNTLTITITEAKEKKDK